jgi:multimeric flavodoxin WrbA
MICPWENTNAELGSDLVMKVLVALGSPRSRANTKIIAREFSKAAKEFGATVEELNLNKLIK